MVNLVLLLCSHSPNDISPEPQRNVSIAAVRGAVRPSANLVLSGSLLSTPMGVDSVVIGFDMEVQPLVTHNTA